MKNSKIKNIINSTDEQLYQEFLENIDSGVTIESNLQGVEYDDSWIDVLYDSIQFLDTIVRNPRKFIIQEEEIVPIEKAKKITLESIRHLAQHTNLIQDVDENGNITPSAVLNVNKEESFDIYENRMIATLLNNISAFIQLRKKVMGEGSFSNSEKKASYEAETNFENRSVKIKVDLESHSREESNNKSSSAEKLSKIEEIMSDFLGSVFMKDMSGFIPVRSPIRKTNVILKDNNFKAAVELWQYIESYDVLSKKILDNRKKHKNPEVIKEKLDESFLLNYIILDEMSNKPLSPKITKYYIKRMIKDFMASNTMDIKEFRKMISTEITEYKREEKKKHNAAKRKVDSIFDRYNKMNDKLLDLLK